MSGGGSRPLLALARSIVGALLGNARRSERRPQEAGESPGQFGPGATRDLTAREASALKPSYDPSPDGNPDPGEVVWTWVPYEEQDGRGKDRPVLIIARIDDETTAACFLTTKHHPGYISVGSGGWDARGRESFLAPERILRVSDTGMRRKGHVLSRENFLRVVAGIEL